MYNKSYETFICQHYCILFFLFSLCSKIVLYAELNGINVWYYENNLGLNQIIHNLNVLFGTVLRALFCDIYNTHFFSSTNCFPFVLHLLSYKKTRFHKANISLHIHCLYGCDDMFIVYNIYRAIFRSL